MTKPYRTHLVAYREHGQGRPLRSLCGRTLEGEFPVVWDPARVTCRNCRRLLQGSSIPWSPGWHYELGKDEKRAERPPEPEQRPIPLDQPIAVCKICFWAGSSEQLDHDLGASPRAYCPRCGSIRITISTLTEESHVPR